MGVLAFVLILVLSVLVPGAVRATPPNRATTVAPELGPAVAAEINAARSANLLKTLRSSRQLDRAARQHALSMAHLGYFSHYSADGSSSIRRITGYYDVKGAIRWGVGEVLLWTPGATSAGEIVGRWLASPFHRQEVLRAKWREIGVGVVRQDDAPGIFGGRDVTIVVVDFGRRR